MPKYCLWAAVAKLMEVLLLQARDLLPLQNTPKLCAVLAAMGMCWEMKASAYWIATRMFAKLLCDAEEGSACSPMSEALLRDMKEKTNGKYASIKAVIPYVYSRTDKAELARHASVLSEELIACDGAARAITRDAARHLHALFQRMSTRCPKATSRVFVDGGVFENTFIRRKFTALCKGVRVNLVGGEECAERGACMLARKVAQA